MVKLIKKFFLEFDMFASYATFRTKGEPETRNLCGGILSFLLVIYFTYVFISQLVHVSNWEQISSVETKSNVLNVNKNNGNFIIKNNISNFMVGVGIDGLTIEELIPFLRFEFVQIIKNGSTIVSSRQLLSQKCTQSHISQLNPSLISQNYQAYNLQNKLCLSPNQNILIQQKSSSLYHTLVIYINACRRKYRNGTLMYSGCANQSLTQQRNQNWIQNKKYFVASVVYLNTIFNPLTQFPTEKIIQQLTLTFTISQGYQSTVWLTKYAIETDTSIWPFKQIITQQGYLLDKNQANIFEIVWYFQHASCTFLLSNKNLLIQRNIGKIDNILSYAGGLFGIIIMVLSIFMMSYNQYRYQLMAAQTAFNYDHGATKIGENNFSFLYYLKYQVYDWINTLFAIQINWSDCKQIDETRQQSTKQLDVSLLFKKIIYFQRILQHILNQQKIGLFLMVPPSIQEVRRNRLIIQYYDKVIQGQPILTLQNAVLLNKILKTALMQQPINHNQNSLQNIQNTTKNNTIQHDNQFQQQMSNSYKNQHKYENNYHKQQYLHTQQPLANTNTLLFNTQEELQQYIQKVLKQPQSQNKDKKMIEFNEEQIQIQKQIARQYFKIPQKVRKNIQMKIPLKILSRLYKIKKQNNNININKENNKDKDKIYTTYVTINLQI